MKIALGSDHTGVTHRRRIRELFDQLRIEYDDIGPLEPEPVDYPDIALAVARAVADGRCDYGVLVCGTGIGVGIVANKVPGILAAVCHDEYSTVMSRRDDHANVLCLGAREESEDEVAALVQLWLNTPFEGGRHQRRVNRIHEIEQEIIHQAFRELTAAGEEMRR